MLLLLLLLLLASTSHAESQGLSRVPRLSDLIETPSKHRGAGENNCPAATYLRGNSFPPLPPRPSPAAKFSSQLHFRSVSKGDFAPPLVNSSSGDRSFKRCIKKLRITALTSLAARVETFVSSKWETAGDEQFVIIKCPKHKYKNCKTFYVTDLVHLIK